MPSPQGFDGRVFDAAIRRGGHCSNAEAMSRKVCPAACSADRSFGMNHPFVHGVDEKAGLARKDSTAATVHHQTTPLCSHCFHTIHTSILGFIKECPRSAMCAC